MPETHDHELELWVDRVPGGLRLSSPAMPGWATVARGRDGIATAMDAAWTEFACARYARSRGSEYDLATMGDEPASTTVRPALTASAGVRTIVVQTRVGTYDPARWTPLPDGSWRSPTLRVYGPQTQHVRRVIAKRQELGLPVSA